MYMDNFINRNVIVLGKISSNMFRTKLCSIRNCEYHIRYYFSFGQENIILFFLVNREHNIMLSLFLQHIYLRTQK